jgi:hypothetical protein
VTLVHTSFVFFGLIFSHKIQPSANCTEALFWKFLKKLTYFDIHTLHIVIFGQCIYIDCQNYLWFLLSWDWPLTKFVSFLLWMVTSLPTRKNWKDRPWDSTLILIVTGNIHLQFGPQLYFTKLLFLPDLSARPALLISVDIFIFWSH